MGSVTLTSRPRRNRRNEGIRRLVRQTAVRPADLMLPLFVVEGSGIRDPIAAMPGRHRLSIDCLLAEAGEARAAGAPDAAVAEAVRAGRPQAPAEGLGNLV